MSSTASNYDVPRMIAGIALMTTSLLLIAFTLLQKTGLLNFDTLMFGTITALYGIMMFASSYVEEEQQFWYLMTGGWMVYLRFRRYAVHLMLSTSTNFC